MNDNVQILLNETWEHMKPVLMKEQARIEELGKLSSLQAGIHDYIRVGYRKGKFNWADGKMFFEISRPFDWSDSAYTWDTAIDITELTDELITQQWLPAFKQELERLFYDNVHGPKYFDYHLELVLHFERPTGSDSLQWTERWIHEPKLSELQKALHTFIRDKVQSAPPIYPKEKDLFHFSRQLVNPEVFPDDLATLKELCEHLDHKLKPIPKLYEDWVRHSGLAFRFWADDRLLPQYYDAGGLFNRTLTLKPDEARPAIEPSQLDKLVYGALRIGMTDSGDRRQYLEYAVQLGSEQAHSYLQQGSGTIESQRRTAHIQGQANDILHTIQIKLLTDTEESYADALTYLCDLLRQGFPVEYSLKLGGSKSKLLLPVKGLAKSPLHRFFVGALQYPALHPLLSEYAQLAMKEFAWYGDVESGEKSVMPGSYAVLGLALHSKAYFPLLQHYMELVDTEHQLAHNAFAEAFISTYQLDEQLLPVLISILLGSGESARPVKGLADQFDSPELAQLLADHLKALEDYQRDLVLYLIFGSQSKQNRFLKQVGLK
ncbi:DUF6138 family protein [Paenibacillus sp. FSL K6-1230]|uniref:DUF6138 family protein n=1 Tax=Paenibacillus sp. FSL K6-1230 TaxID=2921603 RepID=UPI0030F8A247